MAFGMSGRSSRIDKIPIYAGGWPITDRQISGADRRNANISRILWSERINALQDGDAALLKEIAKRSLATPSAV
jgi:hypothetical protein